MIKKIIVIPTPVVMKIYVSKKNYKTILYHENKASNIKQAASVEVARGLAFACSRRMMFGWFY